MKKENKAKKVEKKEEKKRLKALRMFTGNNAKDPAAAQAAVKKVKDATRKSTAPEARTPLYRLTIMVDLRDDTKWQQIQMILFQRKC